MTTQMRAQIDHPAVFAWFDSHARELPWRGEGAFPWAVVVSEFMLQQTPVARVLPTFSSWMERWPTPRDLATSPSGEAVRAWGRLGYPRRALRLHACAQYMVEHHGGEVPDNYEELVALPGIGDYTASAITSFAFGRAHPVLDTNVRRVYARAVLGTQWPGKSVTRAERSLAESLLPIGQEPQWAAASMELGALVCTASSPRCHLCPLEHSCAWRTAGAPESESPTKTQTYAGTDRQVRGRILKLLRETSGTVGRPQIDLAWDLPAQRERALESLLADGLVVESDGRFGLPS